MILVIIFLFIIGSVLGSFIDCAAFRYSNHISIIKNSRSFCPACKSLLRFYDLIPILSYLFLQGKCRYCGSKISIRHFLSELILPISFILMYLLRADYLSIFFGCVISSFLLFASLVDVDTMTVPNRCFISIFVLWITSIFFSEDIAKYLIVSSVGGLVIPGVIFGISLIINKRCNTECIGGGDIKLLFSVGLFLGGLLSLLNILLMSLLGIIYISIKKIRKDKKFAFVPFLSISTILIYALSGYLEKWYEMLIEIL